MQELANSVVCYPVYPGPSRNLQEFAKEWISPPDPSYNPTMYQQGLKWCHEKLIKDEIDAVVATAIDLNTFALTHCSDTLLVPPNQV